MAAYVVEHVADSASGESLEGVNVDYRNLEESVPFGAENYSFLTDNFGEDAQEVMVQRKITSVGEMTVSDGYGIGINQAAGLVRAHSSAPINGFSVFDITDRELLQQKVHDNDGFEEFQSNLQDLEKGNYIGIATDQEGNRNVTQFITGINGWQTSKGYNPTQKSNNYSRKKKTLENEVTTAYERVFAKEGFKTKKDTIFLNYNEGKDTILNSILARIPENF